jgi:hypothetical protein
MEKVPFLSPDKASKFIEFSAIKSLMELASDMNIMRL